MLLSFLNLFSIFRNKIRVFYSFIRLIIVSNYILVTQSYNQMLCRIDQSSKGFLMRKRLLKERIESSLNLIKGPKEKLT